MAAPRRRLSPAGVGTNPPGRWERPTRSCLGWCLSFLALLAHGDASQQSHGPGVGQPRLQLQLPSSPAGLGETRMYSQRKK